MMFRQERGSQKEISLSDGTVSIVLMGNPLALSPKERELVYALVDRLAEFKKHREDRLPAQERSGIWDNVTEVPPGDIARCMTEEEGI